MLRGLTARAAAGDGWLVERALLADLRAAFGGRVVVCVTHDDTVERPGDAVLDLAHPALAGA